MPVLWKSLQKEHLDLYRFGFPRIDRHRPFHFFLQPGPETNPGCTKRTGTSRQGIRTSLEPQRSRSQPSPPLFSSDRWVPLTFMISLSVLCALCGKQLPDSGLNRFHDNTRPLNSHDADFCVRLDKFALCDDINMQVPEDRVAAGAENRFCQADIAHMHIKRRGHC